MDKTSLIGDKPVQKSTGVMVFNIPYIAERDPLLMNVLCFVYTVAASLEDAKPVPEKTVKMFIPDLAKLLETSKI